MAEGWELVANVEPWEVNAEVLAMSCGYETPPVVSGHTGEVRDLTIDWNLVARRLGESVLTSVVWSRAAISSGDTTMTAGTLDDLESTTRLMLGIEKTRVQALATFGSGQTVIQMVDVAIYRS